MSQQIEIETDIDKEFQKIIDEAREVDDYVTDSEDEYEPPEIEFSSSWAGIPCILLKGAEVW